MDASDKRLKKERGAHLLAHHKDARIELTEEQRQKLIDILGNEEAIPELIVICQEYLKNKHYDNEAKSGDTAFGLSTPQVKQGQEKLKQIAEHAKEIISILEDEGVEQLARAKLYSSYNKPENKRKSMPYRVPPWYGNQKEGRETIDDYFDDIKDMLYILHEEFSDLEALPKRTPDVLEQILVRDLIMLYQKYHGKRPGYSRQSDPNLFDSINQGNIA